MPDMEAYRKARSVLHWPISHPRTWAACGWRIRADEGMRFAPTPSEITCARCRSEYAVERERQTDDPPGTVRHFPVE